MPSHEPSREAAKCSCRPERLARSAQDACTALRVLQTPRVLRKEQDVVSHGEATGREPGRGAARLRGDGGATAGRQQMRKLILRIGQREWNYTSFLTTTISTCERTPNLFAGGQQWAGTGTGAPLAHASRWRGI